MKNVTDDGNRKNRPHVKTVRGKDDKFTVIMSYDNKNSDDYNMSWNKWVKGGQKDHIIDLVKNGLMTARLAAEICNCTIDEINEQTGDEL